MGRQRTDQNQHLPPKMLARVKAKGVKYYYYSGILPHSSKRVDIPLGPSLPEALEKYKRIAKASDIEKWAIRPDLKFLKGLYKQMMVNAKARNLPVTLTLDDVTDLYEASSGRCSLTGIAFNILKDDRFRVRPWAPSIDRIDSSLGYTRENCRMVCAYANSALNEYGEELLLLLARGLLRTARSKTANRVAVVSDANISDNHLTA